MLCRIRQKTESGAYPCTRSHELPVPLPPIIKPQLNPWFDLVSQLTSTSVLALPDFDKPFLLATDGNDMTVELGLSHQARDSI